MAMFNNALHGAKIGNSVEAELQHNSARDNARIRRNYYIGFAVVALSTGVLIALNVNGII
jgi:hypothetical protein